MIMASVKQPKHQGRQVPLKNMTRAKGQSSKLTFRNVLLVKQFEHPPRKLPVNNVPSDGDLEHQARMLPLENVPSGGDLEHLARKLPLNNVPSSGELDHQARQLPLRNVPSDGDLDHQARQLPLKNVPSGGDLEHLARQLPLNNVPSSGDLDHQARQLPLKNVPSDGDLDHQARQLPLKNVPSSGDLEHQARQLPLKNVPSDVDLDHQARQLPLKNVPSGGDLEHQATKLPLRNLASTEHCGRQPRQLSSNIDMRNLFLILCLILTFPAPVCSTNEDIANTHPERFPRQSESDASRNLSSWLPNNTSNILVSNEMLPKTVTTCNKGHYLNATKGECIRCPKNTFIPMDNHTERSCIQCEADRYSHEIQLTPANGTAGPIFGCEDRYYIAGKRHVKEKCDNVECTICKNCSALNQFEKRECTKVTDSVCCQEEDMIVDNNENCGRQETTTSPLSGNITAAEEVLTCSTDFYLVISNNTCRPCPNNTYLDKDNHTSTFCLNCSQVTEQEKPKRCPPGHETSGNGQSEMDKWIGVGCGIPILIAAVVVTVCVYKNRVCISKAKYRLCKKQGGSEQNEFPGYHQPDQYGSMIGDNNVELEESSV